jgi:hypothetical protein
MLSVLEWLTCTTRGDASEVVEAQPPVLDWHVHVRIAAFVCFGVETQLTVHSDGRWRVPTSAFDEESQGTGLRPAIQGQVRLRHVDDDFDSLFDGSMRRRHATCPITAGSVSETARLDTRSAGPDATISHIVVPCVARYS